MAKDDDRVPKEESFPVNVAPEMQLYHVLHHLNYGLETALAEFIDNSIQSFLDNEQKLNELGQHTLSVTINIDTNINTISIEDDAFGIDRETIQRALRLGNSKVGFHPKKSLSVYGIGMKSAAVWFSEVWQVETSSFGSSDKLVFDFDLEELIRNETEEADVKIREGQSGQHYTKIVLKNHVRNESKKHYQENVIPYLLETFHRFSSKLLLNIIYDGDKLNPDPKRTNLLAPTALIYPPVNKKGIISKDIIVKWFLTIDFRHQGRRVKGFIMFRDVGGYSQPGIRLLRNNRVIEGTTVYPNIPNVLLGTKNKYAAQRLYGELDISDFPVDFMKTNFNENLTGFYTALKQEVEKNKIGNLIDQATYYRKKLVKKEPNSIILSDLVEKRNTISLDWEGNDLEISEITPPKVDEPPIDTDDELPPKDEKPETEDNDPEDPGHGSGEIFKPSPNNQLPRFSGIENALDNLDEGKLFNLYDSLCTISLKQHSVMCYVSAWCLIEAITARVGRPDTKDFISYLGSKVIQYAGSDRRLKGELNHVIKDISSRGNTTKHSGTFWNTDALDLKNHFRIIAPFLEWLVEENLEKQKK